MNTSHLYAAGGLVILMTGGSLRAEPQASAATAAIESSLVATRVDPAVARAVTEAAAALPVPNAADNPVNARDRAFTDLGTSRGQCALATAAAVALRLGCGANAHCGMVDNAPSTSAPAPGCTLVKTRL